MSRFRHRVGPVRGLTRRGDGPWMVSPIAYDLRVEVTPGEGFEVGATYGFPAATTPSEGPVLGPVLEPGDWYCLDTCHLGGVAPPYRVGSARSARSPVPAGEVQPLGV